MSAHEFVRRLKSHADESDRHYTFWLGAGCSVTSGIPAAATLVKDQWLPRLHRLKGRQDVAIDAWARQTFEEFDPDNLAALYGPLMESLFQLKDDKQRETERLCEKGTPGFGYAVLAALMSRPDGVFSATLTTNFDDLIADSMYVYGDRRPLVIQHDALAGFVRPGWVRRPLVVKVHGDHRLNPMHTAVETSELEKGIQNGIQGLLHDRGVIFIGYAGNDRGVLNALESLSADAIPLGVWWASRREPTSPIRDWLAKRDATWIEASGFDELMLLFREEFEIAHPTAQKFERMVDRYRKTYEHLGARVEGLSETAPDSEALKEAARSARETADDWWQVELEARQFWETDPARADQIYREGTERLEDSRLLASYAYFLRNVREDYDRAEEFYQRAIDADPKNSNALTIYGAFLTVIREDYDRAEELYQRALVANPEDADNLGNYALFFALIREDYDRAEEFYERAIDADPEHANNLGNYARFLADVREDYDRAEELYQRGIAADPEHVGCLGKYARFLADVREDYDRAEELYQRALTADPEDATSLGNYAQFLADVREDYDRAEALYRRLLVVEPEANNLGNFARFLLERGQDAEGWSLVDKALAGADEDPLLAELWFYILALGDGPRTENALPELIRLVNDGVRSPGWDFSGILAPARERGHPDIKWLELLSDVIADHKSADVLDAWPKWDPA